MRLFRCTWLKKFFLLSGLWLMASSPGENTKAQESESPEVAQTASALDTITVTATKTERLVDEVPASVEVLTLETIETQQPQSMDDLLRELPNVEMTSGPRRISEKPFIRGLSSSRVLMTIDGARQNFRSGHKGGLFLDPELLKSVEVIRGPASALHGSNAIGGVISMITKDADDFLKPDQGFGFRLKTGYQEANDEGLFSATVYGLSPGDTDYLISASRRESGDVRLGGGEYLNHSSEQLQSVLAKITWAATLSQTFQFSIEDFNQFQETPVNTEINDPNGLSLVDRLTNRRAFRLGYDYENPETPSLKLKGGLYVSDTHIREDHLRQERLDDIRLRTEGAHLHNTSQFQQSEAVHHTLTYGFEIYQDAQKSKRNGDDLRFFPEAQTQVQGIFLQDEITIGEKWEWLPGFRYDIYKSDATGLEETKQKSQLSPKFSVSHHFSKELRGYVSYAHGFRVPHIQELYISGLHFSGSPEGVFVPNPDLKPEIARNREVGLRIKTSSADSDFRFNTTYFINRIENFIDSTTYLVGFQETASDVTCTNTSGCLFFESRNVQEGHLEGLESELDWRFQEAFTKLRYSQVRGYNETDKDVLGSIPADKLVVDLSWKSGRWHFHPGLKSLIVYDQNRVPRDSTTSKTSGYTIHNLYATWTPPSGVLRSFKFNAGVDNVGDIKYRKHLSQLHEAGRNYKASLIYHF